MDILQLRYFCHAAQTENFSLTAAAFYVPPASVSQSVKRLESELGVRLFNREANKITLNAEGLAFYKEIAQALTLIDDAKKSLTDANMENAGTITILVRTCRRIVTQAIETFKAAYPKVSFVIHHASAATSDVYDFIVSDKPLAVNVNASQRYLLLSEPIVLALHQSHPLARKRKVAVNDLKNEEFVAMSAGNSLCDILAQICTDAGFLPKIAIQCDDPFYVRKYLNEGLGVTFVPQISWRGTFNENVRMKAVGAYTRDTFVWCDELLFLSQIQKRFLTHLKATFDRERTL